MGLVRNTDFINTLHIVSYKRNKNMSIDDVVTQFEGGARANRFAVAITWPGLISAPNVRDNIMVTGASLPSSILGVAQTAYMGRMIPIPGDRIFEDWTIT